MSRALNMPRCSYNNNIIFVVYVIIITELFSFRFVHSGTPELTILLTRVRT